MQTKRINLWSSPRNISTALMYSFAQRPDTTVVDEPLYAHYLRQGLASEEHPGEAEILAAQENDGGKVAQNVLLGSYRSPIVVFKQMTHHLVNLDRSFLADMEHVLLIRDPRRIIHSFAQVIDRPRMEDIGVRAQLELFVELQERGRVAAVLDARQLLLDPRGVLKQLCARLGIPFYPAMLSWKPGARPEDGVWARHWYSAVHRSSGFLPYREKAIDLPAPLERLADECRPYYDQLYQHAIQSALP